MRLERVAPETTIAEACRSLLLSLIACEPDPMERRARLAIMRKDGLL